MVATTPELMMFVALFRPEKIKRDSPTLAQLIRQRIGTDTVFDWTNFVALTSDCCPTMKAVAEALKVQGLSCAAHLIAKSVEHMFRDVQEVEIIHELPERLARLHSGFAHGDCLDLWP
jgi:hypothetical protein